MDWFATNRCHWKLCRSLIALRELIWCETNPRGSGTEAAKKWWGNRHQHKRTQFYEAKSCETDKCYMVFRIHATSFGIGSTEWTSVIHKYESVRPAQRKALTRLVRPVLFIDAAAVFIKYLKCHKICAPMQNRDCGHFSERGAIEFSRFHCNRMAHWIMYDTVVFRYSADVLAENSIHSWFMIFANVFVGSRNYRGNEISCACGYAQSSSADKMETADNSFILDMFVGS